MKVPARASAKARQMASVRTRVRPTIQYSGIGWPNRRLFFCHRQARFWLCPLERKYYAVLRGTPIWTYTPLVGGFVLKRLTLLMFSFFSAHAATVLIYSGFPGNADTGSGAGMNFSGDTLVGSFFASDINFGSSNFQWDPFGLTSNFGADITAKIQVATAGTYTFNTSSDDGSLLFIDNQLVVNNNFAQGVTERQGSIELSAGTHNLEIQYAQGGGGNALNSTLPAGVSYVDEPPSGKEATLEIYQDSSTPPSTSDLVPADATLVGQIPTTNVNFGLPTSNWQPFGLTQQFSAEMQAYFLVPTTGEYTFSTGSDDGSVLFIDGQMVVNNDFFQGYTVRQGTVDLTAGYHAFDLQYFQGGGGSSLTMGVPAGVAIAGETPEPGTWLLALFGAVAATAIRFRHLSAFRR
jgi:hypothetical protein